MRRYISEFIVLQSGVNIPYFSLELRVLFISFRGTAHRKTPGLEKILELN
jgi:hypothetical protein